MYNEEKTLMLGVVCWLIFKLKLTEIEVGENKSLMYRGYSSRHFME